MGLFLKSIGISTSIILCIIPNSVLATQKFLGVNPRPYLIAEGGLEENLKDFEYWLNLCDLQSHDILLFDVNLYPEYICEQHRGNSSHLLE